MKVKGEIFGVGYKDKWGEEPKNYQGVEIRFIYENSEKETGLISFPKEYLIDRLVNYYCLNCSSELLGKKVEMEIKEGFDLEKIIGRDFEVKRKEIKINPLD